MEEIKIRNFKNEITGEKTNSVKIAKKWVEEQKLVKCCGCNECGTFVTSPICSFDDKNEIFSTMTGGIYKIIGIDKCLRKIILNCFLTSDGRILDTLSEVKQVLEQEDVQVRCDFLIYSSGEQGKTSKIVAVDVKKSTFFTESGSIYAIVE